MSTQHALIQRDLMLSVTVTLDNVISAQNRNSGCGIVQVEVSSRSRSFCRLCSIGGEICVSSAVQQDKVHSVLVACPLRGWTREVKPGILPLMNLRLA